MTPPPARRPPPRPPSRSSVPGHRRPARFPFRAVVLILVLAAGGVAVAKVMTAKDGSPKAHEGTSRSPGGSHTGSGNPTSPGETGSGSPSAGGASQDDPSTPGPIN